mmetsp:Transcript_435/g.960  ORF Transcript_435/g.960 Transcript_435/m.960 type:complete len:247 (-) Transcript_435:360-1100(-)
MQGAPHAVASIIPPTAALRHRGLGRGRIWGQGPKEASKRGDGALLWGVRRAHTFSEVRGDVSWRARVHKHPPFFPQRNLAGVHVKTRFAESVGDAVVVRAARRELAQRCLELLPRGEARRVAPEGLSPGGLRGDEVWARGGGDVHDAPPVRDQRQKGFRDAPSTEEVGRQRFFNGPSKPHACVVHESVQGAAPRASAHHGGGGGRHGSFAGDVDLQRLQAPVAGSGAEFAHQVRTRGFTAALISAP